MRVLGCLRVLGPLRVLTLRVLSLLGVRRL